jgi:anti-sigma-K factor RskA
VISEQTEEQASLYVLGLLSPDEARQFEAWMEADPEVAKVVRRAEAGAAALAWTAPPVTPPARVRSRLASAIEQEAKPRRKKAAPVTEVAFNWFPWALAACLLVMLGVFGFKRYQNRLVIANFILRERSQQAEVNRMQEHELALEDQLRQAGRENADLLAQLDQARGQIADLKSRDALADVKIAMLASIARNSPDARAVVAWDPASQHGIVKTAGMPAAGADQDYQLWVIDPNYQTPVSAGVFNPATGGGFSPVHRIMKADKFAVSLEKKGGSATTAQGPIVMVGE